MLDHIIYKKCTLQEKGRPGLFFVVPKSQKRSTARMHSGNAPTVLTLTLASDFSVLFNELS